MQLEDDDFEKNDNDDEIIDDDSLEDHTVAETAKQNEKLVAKKKWQARQAIEAKIEQARMRKELDYLLEDDFDVAEDQ
ncbi:MAG: hypothetical protein AAGG80_00220 [Pseudomonadota bacterium]